MCANENPWHPSLLRPLETTASVTLLSPACRQLYKETALLPFRLNSWSWDSTYTMERYVLKEKRLTFLQLLRVLVSLWEFYESQSIIQSVH